MTLFNGGERKPEDTVVSIFPTVYEHHGEYSHDPPLGEVEVLGAEPAAEVRATLSDYGFTEIRPTAGGFVASRPRSG